MPGSSRYRLSPRLRKVALVAHNQDLVRIGLRTLLELVING
ncbi:hypothetical protein [Xylanimonas oleitrophica]|nr:hypothetical protein [Xylanimonas oleitrophica]